MTRHQVRLDWTVSAYGRRLMVLAALSLTVGLVLAKPAVVALALAPLSLLLRRPRRRLPARSIVTVTTPPQVFERAPFTVQADVSGFSGATVVLTHEIGEGLERTDADPRGPADEERGASFVTVLRAARWGRWDVGHLVLDAHAEAGLLRARAVVPVGLVKAFPAMSRLRRLDLVPARRGLTGSHTAGWAGEGSEFASLREFRTGDALSRIAWSASLRSGTLQVIQGLAETSVDIVVVVDALTRSPVASLPTLDVAYRGALAVVNAALALHDRAGVVALGGWLRWVDPGMGEEVAYRVADAILDVVGRESDAAPDQETVVRAVPVGARVVYLTPLVEESALLVAHALRRRGHALTVIDVFRPPDSPPAQTDDLAWRLWLLERAAARQRLERVGVPVVRWAGDTALEPLLNSALSHRLVRP